MLTPASGLWQGRRGGGRGQRAENGAEDGAGDGPGEAPGDAPGCGRGYSATRRERITSSPRKRSRLKTTATVTRSFGSHRIAARVPASAPVLSLIHISEPTRLGMISYAVFCLK